MHLEYSLHSSVMRLHLYRLTMFLAGYSLHRVHRFTPDMWEATWIGKD